MIYTAADSNYIKKFLIPFVVSASVFEYTIILSAINPTNHELKILERLHRIYPKFFYEIVRNTNINKKNQYAEYRFTSLKKIKKKYNLKSFWIFDIDTIILKKLPKINKKFAITLRDEFFNQPDQKKHRVLAGSIFWNLDNQFDDYFNKKIKKYKSEWFRDQLILADLIQQLKSNDIHKLDHNFMSLKKTNGYVFSAKGVLKKSLRFQILNLKYKAVYIFKNLFI